MANSVDPDEAAHNELPHQDLLILQIQVFLFLVLQGLDYIFNLYNLTPLDFLNIEGCKDTLFAILITCMVGCFWHNGPLRQFFSLYRAIS